MPSQKPTSGAGCKTATCTALCAYVSKKYAAGRTITAKATVGGIPLIPVQIFGDINRDFHIPANKSYTAADIKSDWTMQAFANDIDQRVGKPPPSNP
jgi:hypothetical protein